MTASPLCAAAASASVTFVADDRRMDFLPALFGLPLLMIGEQTIYSFMERLSPDYGGGMWEFLERNGAPLYLRPESDARFRIVCDMNDFEGEASADAAARGLRDRPIGHVDTLGREQHARGTQYRFFAAPRVAPQHIRFHHDVLVSPMRRDVQRRGRSA